MKHISTLLLVFFYVVFGHAQSCTTFEDTLFRTTIMTNQIDYGEPIYEHNNLSFRVKYNEAVEGLSDGLAIGDAEETGYEDYNINYSGNVMYQGNVITQIDFNQTALSNLVVEFDIDYIVEPLAENPFYINEADQNNLPDSTSWVVDTLAAGLHVTISGAVHTIALKGWEVAVDNVCVQEMNSSIALYESTNDKLNVFPNPTGDLLHIDTHVNLNQIELYESASGRLVFSTQSNEKVLDLSGFNDGVYFLTCYSDNEIFTAKVLKLGN